MSGSFNAAFEALIIFQVVVNGKYPLLQPAIWFPILTQFPITLIAFPCIVIYFTGTSFIFESMGLVHWLRDRIDGFNPSSDKIDPQHERDLYAIATTYGHIGPFTEPHAWMYPTGFMGNPPGYIEDFIRLISQDHVLVSLFLASRFHPYKIMERRLSVFISLNLGFFSFCMTYAASNGEGGFGTTLLNILIICPLLIFLQKIVFFSVVCPCLVGTDREDGCLGCIKNYGTFTAVCIALISILLAWNGSAAVDVISKDNSATDVSVFYSYLQQILLPQLAMQLLFQVIPFLPTDSSQASNVVFGFFIYIFGFLNNVTCGFLGIGAWYTAREKAFAVAEQPSSSLLNKYGTA